MSKSFIKMVALDLRLSLKPLQIQLLNLYLYSKRGEFTEHALAQNAAHSHTPILCICLSGTASGMMSISPLR